MMTFIRQKAADFVLQNMKIGRFSTEGSIPKGGLVVLQHDRDVYYGTVAAETSFEAIRIRLDGSLGFRQMMNGRYWQQTRLVGAEDHVVHGMTSAEFALRFLFAGHAWMRPDPLLCKIIGMRELRLTENFTPGSPMPLVFSAALCTAFPAIFESFGNEHVQPLQG